VTGSRERVLAIVLERAYERREEPLVLRSGERSRHFVDVKRGFARGADLRMVCEAILESVAEAGIEFDAIGGLTMGADQFAHGVAIVGDKDWFVVRKERKGRGTDQLVEGCAVGPGTRVLLVEDTVTTGGSIQQAHHQIVSLGAQVVGAVTVVDRGDTAAAFFAEHGVPYLPLLTYADLDIPPVGYGLEEDSGTEGS